MMRNSLLILTSILALSTVACSDDESAEYPPTPTPVPTQTTVQPTPQPTGNYAAQLPAGAGLLVAPILQGTAEKETQGMSAEGPSIVASFMEGQIFDQDFTIQANRCYTVVAVGLGVHELDSEVLLNQPPAPETVLAGDSKTGPHSVVGGSGNCYRYGSPVAVQVKIRTRATKGSGIVMTQVYSK